MARLTARANAMATGVSVTANETVATAAIRTATPPLAAVALDVTAYVDGVYVAILEGSIDQLTWVEVTRIKSRAVGQFISAGVIVSTYLFLRVKRVSTVVTTGATINLKIITSEQPTVTELPDTYEALVPVVVNTNTTTVGDTMRKGRRLTVTAVLVVSARVDGTYTLSIEGSHDGVAFVNIASAAGLSANGATFTTPTSSQPWLFYRAKVVSSAVTTGATVQMFTSAQPE